MSNEKKTWLCSLFWEVILPLVIGFIISHYRNPYSTARVSWNGGMCGRSLAANELPSYRSLVASSPKLVTGSMMMGGTGFELRN